MSSVERHHRTGAQPELDWLILVHSHLRWDFVWQRPQQLLSRLAESCRVVFVEEPVRVDDARVPRLAITRPLPRVQRVVPVLPADIAERFDEALDWTRILLQAQLSPRGELALDGERVVHWFYTPRPAPAMLGAFGEVAVVYDCMDELSSFRFAPADLPERERMLLARADVVFTGGRRLYEAKSRLHDDVHFFGCGVDAAHFARARSADTPIPPELVGIEGPVLGYVGVIDERLDYELLRTLAEARGDWTIAMVGPLAKVDPAELPALPNVRWLGQRPYAELPAYLKRFDVCLMPFALNEATEFINPTKTLEYLAAGKPVVSTPVPDVARHFADVVRIADDADAFVAACADALARTDDARTARALERVATASWDAIVGQMRELIARAAARRILARRLKEREQRTARERAAERVTGDDGRRRPVRAGPDHGSIERAEAALSAEDETESEETDAAATASLDDDLSVDPV